MTLLAAHVRSMHICPCIYAYLCVCSGSWVTQSSTSQLLCKHADTDRLPAAADILAEMQELHAEYLCKAPHHATN